MEIILHSVQSVFSIVIMMAVGIVLARNGWFDKEGSSQLIADLVTKVSLPCMVLLNITNNFNRGNIDTLAYDMVLPFISVVISYIVSWICCRLLKVPKGRRAIFRAMFYVANCIYIGLPLNIALFGEESTVYIFEYFMVNTTALWCLAVYELAADGAETSTKMGLLEILKKIIVSPFIGFLMAIVVIVLNIQLPPVLKDSLRYIGSMTTPLSMIFVGIALSKIKIDELKINFEMFVAHIGKFVVGPLSMFIFYDMIPLSNLHFQVMVIQAATPVAVALPLLAATYSVDVKYAAILTSTSTILFIFVVPLYMWILHVFLGI